MFNNHSMSVVTNLDLIANQINNIDYITVAAITSPSNYPAHPNIYNAGILMPPTELLMAWSDGDPLIMENEYPRYLSSKDPDDMIVALLAAMTKKNVILYIPNDEFMIYGPILMNHLYIVYGITCNFMNVKFSIDAIKIPIIISKFYMMDLMNPNDYLLMYPSNQPLPIFVINKLAEDLHPFPGPATFDQYAQYFNELNARNIQKKVMVNIVTNGGDPNDCIPKQS